MARRVALVRIARVVVTAAWLAVSVNMPGVIWRGGVLREPAVAALAASLFIAVALWHPRLRHWAFVASGVLLVAGPRVSVVGEWPVGLAVALVAGGLCFLNDPGGSRLVVWDDRCSLCRPRVAFLRRLDWLRIHRFEGASNPEALRAIGLTQDDVNQEMRLRDGSRVYGGFDALARVLMFLPVSFVWAPLFLIPPIRAAGVLAYRFIAQRW